MDRDPNKKNKGENDATSYGRNMQGEHKLRQRKVHDLCSSSSLSGTLGPIKCQDERPSFKMEKKERTRSRALVKHNLFFSKKKKVLIIGKLQYIQKNRKSRRIEK